MFLTDNTDNLDIDKVRFDFNKIYMNGITLHAYVITRTTKE